MEDDYYGEGWIYLTAKEKALLQQKLNKLMRERLDNMALVSRRPPTHHPAPPAAKTDGTSRTDD